MNHMKPTRSLLLVCIFILVLLPINVYCQAKQTLKQQVNSAEIVLEGKVIDKRGFWNAEHTQIYSSHLIEVGHVYKGDNIDRVVEIISMGGEVDDMRTTISHYPELKVGIEVVLFCKTSDWPALCMGGGGLLSYLELPD